MIDHYIFKRELSEYKTSLTPFEEYLNQASVVISKFKNISIEEAKKDIVGVLKKYPIKNPIVKFNHFDENGDLSEGNEKLTDYIKNTVKEGEIIVPSFTTYIHPSKKKSLHADFLSINIAKRKKDKENAFKYHQAGDTDKETYFEVMQKVRKIFNNSLSGAYASPSTVLYNPSAHYTLTSITRSVASIGNAVSESIIAGNKHFRTPEITFNYIAAIVANISKNTIEYTLDKYKLYIPTPKEVMDMILYSTHFYWKDPVEEDIIYKFLSKLAGYELAAIMYTNDLWHLKKYNEDFVRNMLKALSSKVPTGSPDPINDISKSAEGVANLAHHICMDEIKGMVVNYKEIDGTPLMEMLGSTARNITVTLNTYKKLFRTFFTTDIMPISIAYIKDMLRDAIVLSDTDSTCGSYDKWVEWYMGHQDYTSKGTAISAAVMTINTQVMDHYIKLFTKNMNIDSSSVELLKMKNEFYWSVFTPSNVSKHYFASTVSREGNIYKEDDLELKGVHLIASAIDQEVVKRGKNMMKEINTIISSGGKISLLKYVKEVADIERSLLERIAKGDLNIFKREKIKEPSAYKKDEEESPYLNHILWEEVFSPKYGSPGEPPYMTIKVPTTLTSKAKLKIFVESIEDIDIKHNLNKFITKQQKEAIGIFRLPMSVVGGKGIPEEITNIIDNKRIIEDSCQMLYIILEMFGFYKHKQLLICESGY